MKNSLLLALSLFSFLLSQAQQPFITTWEVTSGDLDITIPTSVGFPGFNYSYDYTVDFGDGIVLNNQNGNVTHTYSTPGIYTVSISGIFPHFYGIGLIIGNNNKKLKSVEQWGSIQWLSMHSMFYECDEFNINAIDVPDLSQVTSMVNMFYNADSFNSNINNWDVSNITNMFRLFYSANSFNQPLNNWDVSSVTNMIGVFQQTSFNQPINNWNVSNVTTMQSMFKVATNFNQSLDLWDVSNVLDMKEMFRSTRSFNMPINDWDVSNVENMQYMFYDTSPSMSFNQPLHNWDVSSVENMSYMFFNVNVFNQDLNSWNVSNVTNMRQMFDGAEIFNQPLNNWNVSNVTDMTLMFHKANLFNQPLDNWDVSNVISMSNMFSEASNFNQNINNWDTSNVLDISRMFHKAISFNQPLNNWNVSNVENMFGLFHLTENFNQPLDNWDVSNVINMSYMFSSSDAFNQNINNWNVSSVNNMFKMFYFASSFNQPLDNWDISNVSLLKNLLQGASSFNQSLFSWNFNTPNLNHLISSSGIDQDNYDTLLTKLAIIGLEDGNLGANNINYCNVIAKQQLEDNGWFILDDGLSDDCNINYLSGHVNYDFNDNGCDPNDYAFSNFLVGINDGNNSFTSAIDENGSYSLIVNTGSYDLSIINLDSNFIATPSTQTINFIGQNEVLENIDFCITASQQFEDLSIDIFPLEDAIPGFETDYQVIVSNKGTQTVSNVQVNFAYDQSFQTYVSSSVSTSSTSTDILNFQFTNLEPFSQEVFEITLINAVPPTLNGGEILTFTTQVTPDANDTTPEDNTSIYEQTVVNSFDPNDKMVVQGDEIVDEDIDQYLDYRIRFQNLGTANALNVKITDTIDSNLDWTTFQPITSSHDYRIEIVDGEQINYYFDNINLPFETADPEGSNGYITYKIKPKSTVQIGDTFENTAYIYFDFNLPIITNTVVTTVVDNLDVIDFDLSQINVYPNPVRDKLNIELPNNLNVNFIELFDIQGKLVKSFSNQTELDFSNIQQSIYILKLDTDRGSYHHKVIKK